MKALSVTLPELWAIHTFIRRASSSPDYGQEWNQEEMLRVYEEIVGLEVRKTPGEGILLVADDFLWEITRQVPEMYRVGNEVVGHGLLLKAMAALVEGEDNERDHSPYEDSGRDTRADSSAGATA